MKKILCVAGILISGIDFGLYAAQPAQKLPEMLYFMDIPPVVTASKKEENLDNAPNTMYVVTREEINRRGLKNIGDVLQIIPGFGPQISTRDIQMLTQVRGIASADNDLVTIMINGHKIDMWTEPGLLNGPINLENVDRVEIIVGPGSVLYGADTLCAIVNLIIKDVKKDIIVSEGSANYGSITLNSGSKTDNSNIFISASGMKQGGYAGGFPSQSVSVQTNMGDQFGAEYPSSFLFGRAEINTWAFQASAYNDTKPELNDWSGGDQGNFTNNMNAYVISNNSKWSDSFSTTLDITYDDQRFARTATEVPNLTITHETYICSQVKTGVEAAAQITSGKNYFQIGAKYTVAQNPDNFLEYWNPSNPLVAGQSIQLLVKNVDVQTYGYYVSDDYQLSDKVKIVAACRADQSSVLESQQYYFSPRLAVVDSVSSNWTSKLMYNKATRMPAPWYTSLNPYYGIGNPLAVANPANFAWTAFNYLVSKPETLTAIEFQNIFYVHGNRIALNIYYQRLDDYFTWAFPWTNVGTFDGGGAELDARGKLIGGLGYNLGSAYTHNSFETSPSWKPPSWNLASLPFLTAPNGDMMGVPQFSGAAGVDYQYSKDISVTLTLRYMTNQAVSDSDYFPTAANNIGYYTNINYMDAGFQWNNFLRKGLALRLFGKNLFNKTENVATNFDGNHFTPRGAFGGISLDYSWE